MTANEHTAVIAKNTLYLYLRTFVMLILVVYASRVLLATLGIEDFGIYNLVAGVVGLFASLKTSFVSAVQRFLNYEKGTGNMEKQQQIFSMSLLIHLIISFIFIIVVEFFGIWFITHKLNLPINSIPTALFVFHCSIFTATLNILSVPFDAAVIANEKMNFYAGVGIADACLKLLIIYLLPLMGYSQLYSYAIFIAIIGFVNLMANLIYCQRFTECRLYLFWNRMLFHELATFAGWNFLGNTAFTLVNEGINMILNLFGGVVANAARGIAYQVRAAASQLAANILLASQPRIMQEAAYNTEQTFRSVNKVSRVLAFIMIITLLPLIFLSKPLLDVWLIEIPQNAIMFVQLILFHMIIRSLHGPIDILFKAFGKIGKYQIIDSTTLFLALPFSYLALKFGMPLYYVFITIILVEILNICCIATLATIVTKFNIKDYIHTVIIPFIMVLSYMTLINFGLHSFLVLPNSLITLVIQIILYFCIEIGAVYPFLYKEEKMLLNDIIHNFIMRLKR